jgi:hypothetical protein
MKTSLKNFTVNQLVAFYFSTADQYFKDRLRAEIRSRGDSVTNYEKKRSASRKLKTKVARALNQTRKAG